jgi:glycosyltransferase involved in cell wall biosynthesis
LSQSILFYDDVTEFGGHEKMTVSLITQLFRFSDCRITFVYSKSNHRLAQVLKELSGRFPGRLSLHAVSCRTGLIPTLELIWQIHQIVAIAGLFRRIAPNFAVIVQGNIELSLKGLLAARLAGIKTLTYIPAVRGFSGIPNIPLARIRDAFNRVFYKMPAGYIVISEESRAALLSSHGVAPDDVFIVRNLLDAANMRHYSLHDARASLKLPLETVMIAIIGRVYFKGKGQDFAIKELRSMLGDQCRLLIVGDGPDRGALERLMSSESLSDYVFVRDWLDDPSIAYCAADLILMPSSLEGVPLVLLEALYFGKKVLASDIAPFDEYLPEKQRFALGSGEALRLCVSDALADQGNPGDAKTMSDNIVVDSDINRQTILALLQRMNFPATAR